jgi:two-component system response regulator YesN
MSDRIYDRLNENTTLCVIDDIKAVTEGISTQIEWERHGITVCGTANNGQEGWDLIESLRPDIILTDIRMPKMSGLAMTEKVREHFPDAKVLVITGYNDFEYAQQALKLGAFDLITKPFSLQQIEEAVLKAKQSLEQEREHKWQLRDMGHKLKESLPMLRQEFFQLLIRHKWDKKSTLERLHFFEVDLAPEHLAVMVLEVDHFDEESKSMSIRDIELTRFALQNILEETLQESAKGIVYRESSSRFVAIYNINNNISALSVAERCRGNVNAYTRYTVSIGLGGAAADMEGIPLSYEQAIAALSYHFYTGGNGVFVYDDICRFDRNILPAYSHEEEQELSLVIRSGNESRALAILDSVFMRFGAYNPPLNPEYLVSLCYELGYLILRTLQEKIPADQIEPLGLQLRNIRTRSILFAELQSQVKEICAAGCRLIGNMFQTETMKAIDHSIAYIRSNLDQELTITHCAKHAYLSPSYYSNLFKQATGLTFIQFLTHERMEQAKAMLLEDQQVQDISERLGYANRRYFSDLFKKHTGRTPSEFRHDYFK